MKKFIFIICVVLIAQNCIAETSPVGTWSGTWSGGGYGDALDFTIGLDDSISGAFVQPLAPWGLSGSATLSFTGTVDAFNNQTGSGTFYCDGLDTVQGYTVEYYITEGSLQVSGDNATGSHNLTVYINGEWDSTEYTTFSVSRTSVPEVALNLTKTGSGTVQVNGISRTLPWSGFFTFGADVTLRAVPQTGSVFVNWSGDIKACANPITLMMEDNANVMARFTVCDNLSSMSEDFETGNFSQYPWLHSGDANWTVVSYEGSYAARSGTISDNQQSGLHLTCNVPAASEISFFMKVSSEESWDYLVFYIDGEEVAAWSGAVDWEQVTYDVSPGRHIFSWVYEKDESEYRGSDCAWIDDVVLSQCDTGLLGIDNPDFNGDGKTDLLWRDVNTGLYLGTIMNDLTKVQSAVLGGSSTGLQIVGLADFNADNKTDLLWRDVNTGLYLGTIMGGSTGLTKVQSVVLGGSSTGLQIVGLADFNADNKTDLLWRDVNTGLYLGTIMGGSTGLTKVQSVVLGGSSTGLQIVDLPDFNADNKTDLLWRDVNTGLYLGTIMGGSTGLTKVQSAVLGGSSTGLQIVDLADFNADNKTDLLWRDVNTGLYLGTIMGGATGLTKVQSVVLGGSSTGFQIVDLADFNADNKTDLLWRDVNTGLYLGTIMGGATGLTKVQSVVLGGSSTGLQIVDLPDFNGDFKTDLLWRDVNTGLYLGTIMGGATGLTKVQSVVLGGSSTGLQIVGLAYFNIDDKTDLLWRDVNTGLYLGTLMNSLTKVQSKSLGGSSTTFQIVAP
jgi:hypothetical protein